MGFLDPSSWANALSDDPTGSKYAADKNAQAMGAANALQLQEWTATQENQKPWLLAGTSAVNQLNAGLQPGGQFNTPNGPTLGQLQMDPGYAWRTQQGVNALSAAGAAGGSLGSGNLGTALIGYGQQAASQEYQNAYNRWNTNQTNMFNRLSGVAGTGQTAANSLGEFGSNMANHVGGNLVGAAQGYGMAAINNQAARMGGISHLSGQLTDGINNYLQYQAQQNALNGALYNGAGGDINSVNFGSLANDTSTMAFD